MNNEKFNNYDVFHAFLVENAEFDGYIELPVIKTSDKLPKKVVTFSKAMTKSWTDFDCWVVFYEHDKEFERLWNNPKQYLDKLKKFKGVISPDFSLYRNMPLCMQMWNTYRGRAVACWLQNNGVEIIPNLRFGDERTFSFCFDGIEENKTVSVTVPSSFVGVSEVTLGETNNYTLNNTGDYDFVYDENSKTFTSTNQAKNNSKCILSFTPKADGTLTFDVYCSSEAAAAPCARLPC